jgi:iron complex transport system ATP-binding protein
MPSGRELAVTDLAVALDGRPILSSISFTAPAGKVTTIVGPNGAGKSTLLRAIAGLHRPLSGEIRLDARDLLRSPRRERAKLLALVEQRPTHDIVLSVRSVVELGRIPHQSLWSHDTDEDMRIVDDAIAALDLGDLSARSFSKLSGGEQQRVQIARAVAQQPTIFLLDEPTNHLDIQAQLTVFRFVRAQAELGNIVLLTLHDLNQAADVSDQVVVLNSGACWGCGSPAEIVTPRMLGEVYGVGATTILHPRTGRPILLFDDQEAVSSRGLRHDA